MENNMITLVKHIGSPVSIAAFQVLALRGKRASYL